MSHQHRHQRWTANLFGVGISQELLHPYKRSAVGQNEVRIVYQLFKLRVVSRFDRNVNVCNRDIPAVSGASQLSYLLYRFAVSAEINVEPEHRNTPPTGF